MSVSEAIEQAKLFQASGITSSQMDKLHHIGYFGHPASRSHHLADFGGLIKHSVNVTRRLLDLTKTLDVKWSRAASPYLVGLLHDFVKCQCYNLKGVTDGKPEWEYIQPAYPGHGACSAAIAAELGIQLYRDEIVAITYHMGVFGIGKEYTEKEFDNAVKCYGAQIIATHCADWYAARVDEIQEVICEDR